MFEQIIIDKVQRALDGQMGAMSQEITQQGHVDTGALRDSLTARVFKRLDNQIVGQILMSEEYGYYVDQGVAANRVNYPPQVLVPWILRNLNVTNEEEALSVAWAIRTTHKRTGIPSPGSFAFSNNGFRTNWTERSIEAYRPKFNDIVRGALADYAEALLQDVVRESQQNQAA